MLASQCPRRLFTQRSIANDVRVRHEPSAWLSKPKGVARTKPRFVVDADTLKTARQRWIFPISSYLASGHKVERPQGALHVWNVGLKLVERICDARLNLRGLLPRGAVGSDLVQCGVRHIEAKLWLFVALTLKGE